MSDTHQYPLLSQIDSPADLRALPEGRLVEVARELRACLIDTVSGIGGHFAAGLGTVELTVALHYIYDTPEDRIVWDVGHQAYPHKVLTGRRDRLHTIRKFEGLAPFPRREESPYDTLGVGHAGTATGAALGMALALRELRDPRKVVAVVGDGAMTAGMAFEALNHGGEARPNMLVILNDNAMSISENVGALVQYFNRLISGRLYTTMREGGKRVLSHMPPAWELARRSETAVKGVMLPGALFEELGWNYVGPVDGHDLPELVHTLRNLHDLCGPQLLHVVTRKGKGYAPAEADPTTWHGPSAFDAASGTIKKKAGKPTYSKVFGQWACDMAGKERRLYVITPAMREGSGLVEYQKQFPKRYADVSIAEQHSVTVAAGLAIEGLKPVVAIYSTFLQRGYDQLIHDVAIQNLPVLFAIDRAGIVGGDGATHQGAFDLTYLRCVPNMVVMAPADERECRLMLNTGIGLDQPAAVRYPRGSGPGVEAGSDFETLPVGRAEVRRRGKSGLAILAFGALVPTAGEVADKLDATLVNMRFVKPLDLDLIREMAAGHDHIVTVEDNVIAGGAGSAVGEALDEMNIQVALHHIGLPDHFCDHGGREEVLAGLGLNAGGIERNIRAWLQQERPRKPHLAAS
ncbi:MAG: 1-deoxy-D-xylulose-5-phosphate synthase [Gammaproteobacteria bacterium]|nr:1-deoxy-D-xylulose-5-phosphate synthase [Gammaproteobacteria bacterium]